MGAWASATQEAGKASAGTLSRTGLRKPMNALAEPLRAHGLSRHLVPA